MARDYGGGGRQLDAQGQFVDLDAQIDAELSKQKNVREAAAQQKNQKLLKQLQVLLLQQREV